MWLVGQQDGKVSSVRLFMSVRRRKNTKIIPMGNKFRKCWKNLKGPQWFLRHPQNKTTGAPQKSQRATEIGKVASQNDGTFLKWMHFSKFPLTALEIEQYHFLGDYLRNPWMHSIGGAHQECFGEYSPRVDNLQVIYSIWYPQFSILYFTFRTFTSGTYPPTASWQTFPSFARSPFFSKVTKSQPQKMTLGTVHSQT